MQLLAQQLLHLTFRTSLTSHLSILKPKIICQVHSIRTSIAKGNYFVGLSMPSDQNSENDKPPVTAESFADGVTEASDLPAINHVRIAFGGTSVNLGYVDVGPRDGSVCVCVHGAPGSLFDFNDFIEPLTNAGMRLLTPEFPGTPLFLSSWNGDEKLTMF